jgi:ATP-dependent Clp protease ATP-binding subunit ClpC
VLAEKMLYGEVGPGQIVLVGVEGEGPTATFTFQGQKVGALPDLPPFETAEVGGPAETAEETDGPKDVPKAKGAEGEGQAGAAG